MTPAQSPRRSRNPSRRSQTPHGGTTPLYVFAQRLAPPPAAPAPQPITAEPTVSVEDAEVQIAAIREEIAAAESEGDFDAYRTAIEKQNQANATLAQALAARDREADQQWEAQLSFEKELASARHPQLSDPNSVFSQALKAEIKRLSDANNPAIYDPATYGRLADYVAVKISSNPQFAQAPAAQQQQYAPAPAYAVPQQGAVPVIPGSIPTQQQPQMAAPYPQALQPQAPMGQQPQPYMPVNQHGIPIAPQPPRTSAPAPNPMEAIEKAAAGIDNLDDFLAFSSHLFGR